MDQLGKLGRVKRSGSFVKTAGGQTLAVSVSDKFEGSSFSSDNYAKSDTAYRKAYNSLNIHDIFEYLQCLVDDETTRKTKLAYIDVSTSKEVISSYMESQRILTKRISKFISIMEAYRSKEGKLSLPELFYRLMLKESIEDHTNFLVSDKLYMYKQMLSAYINSPFLNTEGSQKLEERASDLFQFFDQFRVDSYSTLIGMEPSESVIDRVLFNKQEQSCMWSEMDENHQDTSTDMRTNILLWASSKQSPEEILQEVKRCAAILRGVNKLKTGDLAIIEWKKNSYKYARFSGESFAERASICLWTDGHGTELCVSIDRVWPLPLEITKFIMDNIPSRYEKLVKSPLDSLFAELMHISTSVAKEKLRDFNLDNDMLERANQNQCSLLDLSRLKAGLQKTVQLIPPPDDLLVPVANSMNAVIKRYLDGLNEDALFQPTRHVIMAQLDSFNPHSLLTMALTRYRGVLQSALDQINLQSRDMMNGTRKEQLTEHWLTLVDRMVRKKLSSIYFDHDALPNNYTSIPPEDFRIVYRNIGIIRELLDLDNDVHGFKLVIKEVCNEVYPQIKAFVVDSKISILETINQPCDKEDIEAFDIKAVMELVGKSQFTAAKEEWLDNLLKDLEYLSTMVRLEGAPLEERQKHFHIIPISSLMISKLCRLENEHKTALELWAPVAYVKKLQKNTKRCLLHRAISSNDLRAVKSLAKEYAKTKAQNEQDQNGWTPLHCAASSAEKLPVCEILLANGVAINMANNEGNTPLHYLVRCSVSDEAKDLQIRILQTMIKMGGNVNAMNDLGETPLHASCFLGNTAISCILLESYADPNTITKVGESCLHYAVQARQPELVNILLEFGANPYLRCGAANAINMAYKYDFPEITEIFRAIPLLCEVQSGAEPSFAPRSRSSSSFLRARAQIDLTASKKKKKRLRTSKK